MEHKTRIIIFISKWHIERSLDDSTVMIFKKKILNGQNGL